MTGDFYWRRDEEDFLCHTSHYKYITRIDTYYILVHWYINISKRITISSLHS